MIASEGVYWYRPSLTAVRNLHWDLHQYYMDHGISAGRRQSLFHCRQPVEQNVTSKYQYLWAIMELKTVFKGVIRDHAREVETQATKYIGHLRELGVHTELTPYHGCDTHR